MLITRRKYNLVTIKMEEMASNDDIELKHFMLILHFTNKYVLECVQHGHTSHVQFFSLEIFGQYRSSTLLHFLRF